MTSLDVIISSTCFRHHNLCKMYQNFTKFSHIEEHKNRKKTEVNFEIKTLGKWTVLYKLFWWSKFSLEVCPLVLQTEGCLVAGVCTRQVWCVEGALLQSTVSPWSWYWSALLAYMYTVAHTRAHALMHGFASSTYLCIIRNGFPILQRSEATSSWRM